jgi:hypothetical protein
MMGRGDAFQTFSFRQMIEPTVPFFAPPVLDAPFRMLIRGFEFDGMKREASPFGFFPDQFEVLSAFFPAQSVVEMSDAPCVAAAVQEVHEGHGIHASRNGQ